MNRAWLTRNAIPATRRGRCIFLPNDPDWRADFYGAISQLYREYNWEKHGTLTPEEMASEWLDVIYEFLEKPMSCLAIGSIVDYAGSGDLPENYLEADGSSILIEDYPELYGVFGNTYGIALPGYFKLPDCQTRVVIGVGSDEDYTYALGDTGGENSIVINEDSMPEHVHDYNEPTFSFIVQGEGAPATVCTSVESNITGANGSGEPHENRQKFIAFRKCVIAY